MSRYVSFLPFLALVLGGGLLIGYFNMPGAWYEGLTKPAFNPPGWLFGPVWTVLYILIAIAGWRLWQAQRGTAAMGLWWVALVANFLWSPTFFSLHNPGLSLAVIIVLLGTIFAFIAKTWPLDRVSSLMFLPYAAWVSFATVLNAAIWGLN